MARMFPQKFPEEWRQDPLRRAEKQVYDGLEAQLPRDWLVFYSVPWTAPYGPGGSLRDGEADFVVLHPRRGWLILEVKGGEVGYDGDHQTWWQPTRDGLKHCQPFDQARKNAYHLRDLLADSSRAGLLLPRLSFGYGAVFPNVSLRTRSGNFPPAVRPVMVIDEERMERLDAALDALLASYSSDTGLLSAEDGLKVEELFRSHLAPILTLHSPLAGRVREAINSMVTLNALQVAAVRGMAVHRRLAVSGCAGSGKTLLAVEKACLLAADHYQVRLVCRSRPLAHYLGRELAAVSGVFVSSFADLAAEMARAAQLPASQGGSDAERMLDSLAMKPDLRCDALIVDEGQDFTEEEWTALSDLVTETGVFYVFYDNNQRLRTGTPGDCLPESLGLLRWSLTQNVRNARPIFDRLTALYEAPEGILPFGPSGPSVETIAAATEAQLRPALSGLLRRLLNGERVAPSDVIVLTPRSLEDSALPAFFAKQPVPQNAIRYATIEDFKGLESPVVVLTELDALFEEMPNKIELAYVGLSRARGHLVLMGDPETLAAIEAGLR